MRILITGMTPTQCGRPGRFQWLVVPALFAEALRLAGHDVEHRPTEPNEDLTPYDVILVGLVPPGSIAARHVYVVMDVIARAKASGAALLFYVDDWQYDKIHAGCKNKSKHPHGMYNSIQGRTFRDWAETDEGRARVAHVMDALATRPWPTTIAVAFPWGDHSLLPKTPAREMVFVDPSPLAWDKIAQMRQPDRTELPPREQRWVLASLSRHHDWVGKQNLEWPVELVGPKHTGAEYTLKEHEVVQLVERSWGTLVPPYHHAGSGWWRPRLQYASMAGAIALVNERDAALLGGAYRVHAADVESATDAQRIELAYEQRNALMKLTWDTRELVERMHELVMRAAGKEVTEVTQVIKSPLVGLVDREYQSLSVTRRLAVMSLAADSQDAGYGEPAPELDTTTHTDTDQVVQPIRQAATQRDTEREFDRTYLRENKHGKRVHRDYAAHFFRWGWATRLIGPEDHVLDVGCGPDLALANVLSMGGRYVPTRYVGVDLNKLSGGPGWAELHGEFNFIERYAELFPDGPPFGGTFTKVVCFEVIEHMTRANGIALLNTINVVLKPGGELLLSTPVFNGKAAANHVHEWTVDELSVALADAGFIVQERYGTFASYPDIKRIASARDMAVLEELRSYYSDEVTACFLAPLYPDQSRNNVWRLTKEGS